MELTTSGSATKSSTKSGDKSYSTSANRAGRTAITIIWYLVIFAIFIFAIVVFVSVLIFVFQLISDGDKKSDNDKSSTNGNQSNNTSNDTNSTDTSNSNFYSLISDLNIQYFNNQSILNYQFRGTHNSYHKMMNSNNNNGNYNNIGSAPPINLYDYDTLTSQLNSGIRSLELDIQPCYTSEYGTDINGYARETHSSIQNCSDYMIYHIDFYDNNTNCDTLSQCMSELIEWSYLYRNYHFPLFIKIELKSLDSWKLSNLFNRDENNGTETEATESEIALYNIIKLFEFINDTFYEHYNNNNTAYFTYDTFANEHSNNWQDVTLGDMRGKILFYLTKGSTNYIETLINDIRNNSDVNSMDNILYPYSMNETVNDWPVILSDYVFPTCKTPTSDYCQILEITDSGDLEYYANLGEYLVTTRTDRNYIEIEDYSFNLENNFVSYYNNTDDENIIISIDNWEVSQWYKNIQLRNYDSNDNLITNDEIGNFTYYYNDDLDTALEIQYILDNTLNTDDDNITNVNSFNNIINELIGINSDIENWLFPNNYNSSYFNNYAKFAIETGANILITDYPNQISNTIFNNHNESYFFRLNMVNDCSNDNNDNNVAARLNTACLLIDSEITDSDCDETATLNSNTQFGCKIDQIDGYYTQDR